MSSVSTMGWVGQHGGTQLQTRRSKPGTAQPNTMVFHITYVILVVVLAIMPHSSKSCSLDLPEEFANLVEEAEEATPEELPAFETLVNDMADELKKLQFYVDERIRTEGHSGAKKIRMRYEGTRPYHGSTHTGHSFANIYNIANTRDKIGFGELTIVMNGAEFHTKHGDYLLQTRSPTGEADELEDIEYPGVPEEVTALEAVEDQITEMQEWFKAWANQDKSVRDYRQYFKPVLCYIEGAWFLQDGDEDNTFSEYRFMAASGNMDSAGRYEFLPSRLVDVVDGVPVYAQWRYRKLCQALNDDIPLNRFRAVDDLGTRLRLGLTYEEYVNSSAARFQLNPINKPRFSEHMTGRSYVDDQMEQIPGLNGYNADLTDDAFGLVARRIPFDENGQSPVLDTSKYHRWYKVAEAGASGSLVRHRGYNDENLFMAMTTDERIIPIEAELCEGRDSSECETYTQRWTFALPMEIIFLTPLSTWNPYSIEYKGDASSEEGATVTARGRNGSPSRGRSFDGVNSENYYITPAEFFEGDEIESGVGDTTRGMVGVLDPEGNVRRVRASGHRIAFPPIPGVGFIRQRFPIMPVHGEGGSSYKEMEALKDVILEPLRYGDIYRQRQQGMAAQQEVVYKFILQTNQAGHYHEVMLPSEQVAKLYNGETLEVRTESTSGHQHELTLVPVVNKWQQMKISITTLSPYQNHGRTLGYEHFTPAEQMVNE